MTGKERLIEILHILREETDVDHQYTTARLLAYFKALGVPTNRKTISSDIDTLVKGGINIVENKGVGTNSQYFYDDRTFELPELKLRRRGC